MVAYLLQSLRVCAAAVLPVCLQLRVLYGILACFAKLEQDLMNYLKLANAFRDDARYGTGCAPAQRCSSDKGPHAQNRKA